MMRRPDTSGWSAMLVRQAAVFYYVFPWGREHCLYATALLESPHSGCGKADMSQPDSIVYVVDDDAAFRESLVDLLDAWQFDFAAFETAHDYMASPKRDCPSCLLLDVGLPDISGLELQQRLTGIPHPPIVFLSGRGDIPQVVQAMRAGAVEFLTKPFEEMHLLAAIQVAIQQDRSDRALLAGLEELRKRLALLTPREQQVLPLIIGGLLNKQAASELGISEVTLQAHRSRIMKKMRARSIADLVRMSSQLNVPFHRRDARTTH
jgi:FixJ family two-component response regulator